MAAVDALVELNQRDVVLKRRRLILGVDEDVAEADPVGVLNQGGVVSGELGAQFNRKILA